MMLRVFVALVLFCKCIAAAHQLMPAWHHNPAKDTYPVCKLATTTDCILPFHARASQKTFRCADFTSVASKSPNITLFTRANALFDRAIADKIAAIAYNTDVFEFGAGIGCYSMYWATSQRFLSLRSIERDTLAAKECDVRRVERAKDYGQIQANRTYDWVIAFGVFDRIDPRKEAVTLFSVLRHTRYGVAITWASQASDKDITNPQSSQYVIDQFTKRGFVLDQTLTDAARSFTREAAFKQYTYIFYKQQVVAYHYNLAFMREKNDIVKWNYNMPYAGEWFRVFISPATRWSNQRIAIGVMSTPGAAALRNVLRETWIARARSLHIIVLFVVGRPTHDLVVESERYGDIIMVESTEIYTGMESIIPLKTHLWWQIVSRFAVDAKWAMKCDPDTIVFTDRLVAMLETFNSSTMTYIGAQYDVSPIRDTNAHHAYVSRDLWPANQYPRFMSGGAGYVLSMPAIRCMTEHTQSKYYHYFPREDPSTRIALNEAGCAPLNIVDRTTQFKANSNHDPTNNIITMHYVKDPKMFYQLWQKNLNAGLV